jgi:hypothetical protein
MGVVMVSPYDQQGSQPAALFLCRFPKSMLLEMKKAGHPFVVDDIISQII